MYDAAAKSPHPFLEKPFRIARLVDTIHHVLQRSGRDCQRQPAAGSA
jgi:hypothetical protein